MHPLDHLAQRLDHLHHPIVRLGSAYQHRLIATEPGSPATYIHAPSAGAAPDQAYLYLTTRRGTGSVGGSPVDFLYALDVTTPSTPKLLWKHSSSDTGFGALAQTWSQPQIVSIRGNANPVLIMGMGYDAAANDPNLQTAPTEGRGVMVMDALTGALIWQAGASVSGATTNLTVAGMTFDIPADVTPFDSDLDGYADRVYAADTGGNVWRINIGDASPTNWTVDKLASLGGGIGSGANARKFLFAPDVVRASANVGYDSVLIGSGDREHPFDTTVSNRFYLIKDTHAINYRPATVITEGTAGSNAGVANQLLDVSSDLVQGGTSTQMAAATTALATASGWYITLGTGTNGTGATGAKVVGSATTAGGTVFFGTNSPATPATNACTNLGEARLYAVSYIDGSAAIDNNKNGILTVSDRSGVRNAGGFPPTPVAGTIANADGTITTFACFGTTCETPPNTGGGRRYLQYWRRTKQ